MAVSDVSTLKRITSGVKLMDLKEGVTVAGIAKVKAEEPKDEEEAEE